MKTIKANKRKFLSLNKSKKKIKLSIPHHLQDSFLTLLLHNDYKISAFHFLLISIATGGTLGALYFLQLHNLILSIGATSIGFTFPYCFLSSKTMINYKIKDLTMKKIFIELLEAELATTNSTQEAIKNITTTSKDRLSKELCLTCNNIIKDISIGSSLPEALSAAIESLDSKHLKMVFNILRINHEVGSTKTTEGLKMISKSLNSHIEIIKELNLKVGSELSEKTMFFLIVLIGPLIMNSMMTDYFPAFISTWWGSMIIVTILCLAFVGQFLIDNAVAKALQAI